MQGITQYILIALFATTAHLHAQPQDNPTLDRETVATRPLPPWQTYPSDNFTTTITKKLKPAKYRLARHSPKTQPDTNGKAGIVVSNTSLARVAQQIQDQSHTTITLHGIDADLKVTLIQPEQVPIEDLLNKLTENEPSLIIEKTDNGFGIWDKFTYIKEHRRIVTYPLQEAHADDATDILESLLFKDDAEIVRDERLNTLYISALPEKHIEIARYIKELDKKLTLKVFTLKHADPSIMANQISRLFSLRISNVVGDARTRQVAVSGTESEIKRAEAFVQAFDIVAPPPEASGPTTTTQQ